MPLPAAVTRRPLHTRSVTCEGFQRADGLWDIDAHIVDTKSYDFAIARRGNIPAGSHIHEMWLRLTLDAHYVVQDIAAATEAAPWPVCFEAPAMLAPLKGMSLGPGFAEEVRRRVDKRDVCTHLIELLRPMATAAFQTIVLSPAAADGSVPDNPGPVVVDTCRAFRRDGPIVRALWPDYAAEPSS
jgi:hypothetical protein